MEPAQRDLQSLFIIFFEVFKYCEGFYKSPDIYILFKSAKLLEDTYLKLESIGSLEDFESKLKEFWVLKGLKVIPLIFFKNISHQVLSRFITDSNFSNETVKLAIRQFLIFNSQQDLFTVVKKLYHTNQSVDILKQTIEKVADYNAIASLERLSKHISTNKENPKELNSLLTSVASSDISTFNNILISLCKYSHYDLSLDIEGLIDLVASVLKDPNHIHVYACILQLSDAELSSVVTTWNSIADSFIAMLEYSIPKLKCSYSERSYVWLNTGVEQVLTYEEINTLINKLKVVPKVYDQLKELLNRLRQESYELIAEDLLRVCKIK